MKTKAIQRYYLETKKNNYTKYMIVIQTQQQYKELTLS